jgi:hypothetical protein
MGSDAKETIAFDTRLVQYFLRSLPVVVGEHDDGQEQG